MRRVLILLGMVLFLLLIVMALTKTDESEHFAKMRTVALSEVGRQIAAYDLPEETSAILTTTVMGKVNNYVAGHLTVHDCLFFTLGTMRHQGMSVPATLGVFKKVFINYKK